MAKRIRVNGQDHYIDLPPDVPLLWILRDALNLTGTKFGCGVASCGACTVHIDGEAVRSCQVALEDVWGDVTTIEGHGKPQALSSLQKSWIDHQVAQWILPVWSNHAGAALLAENPSPSDAEIDEAMVETVSLWHLSACALPSTSRQMLQEA